MMLAFKMVSVTQAGQLNYLYDSIPLSTCTIGRVVFCSTLYVNFNILHTLNYTFSKIVDTDEHPRPDSSTEKMATLRPVFKKGGVVTAANASGISDGAGRCSPSDIPTLKRVKYAL